MTQEKKSLIEFPCLFPIKIFGDNTASLEMFIKQLFDEKIEKKNLLSYKQGTSKKGNYLAITVTIMAQNQDQLDDIYQALTDSDLVKMAL